MLRIIGAVIVGYIVIAIVVMLLLTLTYVVLGTERVFEASSFKVTKTWVLTSVVSGFIAACLGGVVCAVMAKGSKAPMILAVVVFVLGILFAIPVLTSSDSIAKIIRAGSVTFLEAMQNAKQPAWVALLNPLIGAAGVLVGSRFRKGT